MNAKDELLRELKDFNLTLDDIVCVKLNMWKFGEKSVKFNLNVNHTHTELIDFICSIDFEYDDGYGSQELDGMVWFKNSWLERREYDGSEWWEYKTYPEIPQDLFND